LRRTEQPADVGREAVEYHARLNERQTFPFDRQKAVSQDCPTMQPFFVRVGMEGEGACDVLVCELKI
jgi:hypothetical protein